MNEGGLSHDDWAAVLFYGSIGLFLPCLFLCMAGCAIANTNALQLAIEPLLHIAGTASAAVVSAQLFVGAFAGWAVATLYDGRTPLSTVGAMAVIGLGGMSAFLFRPKSNVAAVPPAKAIAAVVR